MKKRITFSIIGLILLVGAITLYKIFALHDRVSENSIEDTTISVLIDGEESNTMPSKDDGYVIESITFDNGASARWDNDEWSITILNLTERKATCNLSFKTQTSEPMIEYITSLVSTTNDLAYDGTEDNNLRYIGANPNNYVLFNNESWRIIGVMNNITDSEGNKGSHIKIIRNEIISGNYLWSGSSTNQSNNWTKSTLNTKNLNETYNSLTSSAKNMIGSVVWNLGGHSTYNATASVFYVAERGAKVYTGNPTTWTGHIGLMYPSDYGFAVGGGVRNTCLATNLGDYKTNSCYANDWLHLNSANQWTLTSRSSDNKSVFRIGMSGNVSNDNVNSDGIFSAKPVLYLNSNIEIIADETHNGSSQNPYELKLVS